jgi:hypothetical protein
MSIIAHQAYFGIREQRHALLAASGDIEIFDRLYLSTDRPDAPPPNWPPYYSGFPFDDYYVVMRTAPDSSGVRSGMVFTHAVLIPKFEAARLGSLESVMKMLIGPTEKQELLSALNIPSFIGPTRESEVPDINRVAAVVHYLIEGNSVVWLGETGFIAAVNKLWANMWSAARVNFSFGISFNPQDLPTHYPGTLLMGIGRGSRHWNGYPVVSPNTIYQASTEAEKMLLGLSNAKPLREFMDEAGIEVDTLKLLSLLEGGLAIWSRIAIASFDELLLLARIITRYGNVGNHNRNRALTRVLTQLASLMREASVQNLLSTRNLDLAAVQAPLVATLQSACQIAVTKLLKKATVIQDEIRLAQDALIPGFSEAQSWWLTATQQGFREAIGAINKADIAYRIWRWWTAEPLLVSAILSYLPANSEEPLVAYAPVRIKPAIATPLLKISATQAWVRLHAIAAVAFAPTSEAAIQLHIRFDSDPENSTGIEVLSQRIPAAEFIRISLLPSADARMLVPAAQLIVKSPALLHPLIPANEAWRQLWAKAVQAGATFWPPQSDHLLLRDELLEAALQNHHIPAPLWVELAQQPESDLSNYSQRAAIWRILPDTQRSAFLQNTAVGWVKQIHAGKSMPFPEPELSSIILQTDDLLPYRGNLAALVPQAINIINQLPIIPEAQVVIWLQRISNDHEHMSEVSAMQIGKLIKAKRWRDAARTSAIFGHRYANWEPILHECKELLSFVDKLGLQLVFGARKSNRRMISNTEWWAGLQEIAEYVFSSGPSQENLWERAGGKEAKLLTSGTGSERWSHALQLLRTGGGGKHISTRRLLEEMNKSRPQNTDLQNFLKSLPN